MQIRCKPGRGQPQLDLDVDDEVDLDVVLDGDVELDSLVDLAP
jgi:hypothetical protein